MGQKPGRPQLSSSWALLTVTHYNCTLLPSTKSESAQVGCQGRLPPSIVLFLPPLHFTPLHSSHKVGFNDGLPPTGIVARLVPSAIFDVTTSCGFKWY
jgi:hypothetical protein